MEDLSGDMEKTVAPSVLPKPRRKLSGWTLLFVGDHGKIIRLQKFKALMMAWVITSVITLTAAACLGFFYYDAVRKNSLLEDSLIESRQKVRSLRDEKDMLLARVVVSESRRSFTKNRPIIKGKTITARKKEVIEDRTLPKVEPLSEENTVKPAVPVAVIGEPENRPEVEPKSAVPTTISESITPPNPPIAVTIEDFFIIVEPDSNRLRIKYKIRNVDPDSNPVSGRTFIILKSKKQAPESWTVLPVVELISGKPVNVKNGRSFSITRFKTIRFKGPYQNGSALYETATILVYATGGELLLEENFPIVNSQLRPAPAG
jgi:hypothetical protein